jgi:hypothetical protein
MAAPKKAAKRPAKKATQRPVKADSVRKVEDVDLPDATDDSDEESYSERLAQEAVPPKKPKGSPAMRPFITLQRRERATALRAFAKLNTGATAASAQYGDQIEDLENLGGGGTDVNELGSNGLAALADVLDLTADVEDALRVCAADPDAYEAWASKVDDEVLMALFSWYVGTFQVGEATASPS